MQLTIWLWTILTGSKFKAIRHEGHRLLSAGRYNEALEVFRGLVQLWPERADGYLGMSQVYQKMGLRAEAAREATIGDCLMALQERPDDADKRLELAEALMDKEMYGWAAHHMEVVLRSRREDMGVLRLAARAYRRNRNHLKAVGVLREALRIDPLDAELYDLLTASLKALGQHAEAARIGTLGEALSSLGAEPTNPMVVITAVRQFMSAGYLNLALELLDRCIAQGADDARVYLLKATLHLDDRDPQQALTALNRAVKSDPLSVEVHLLLVDVYQIIGEPAEADFHRRIMKKLGQAARSDSVADGAVLYIDALLELGQVVAAAERARSLAAEKPKDWRALYAQGLVARHQKDLKTARSMLQKAINRNPMSPEAHLEMALVHTAMGEKIEAVGEAREAVKVAPRDAGVRRRVADVFRQHGFMDQAIEEEDLADSLEKDQAKR